MSTATTQPEPLQLADGLELHASQVRASRGKMRYVLVTPDECDQAAAELRRLHAENQQLRADLEAVGAGGIGPLIPATVQHQHKPSRDNDLQRENGHLITSSSTAPAGWKLVLVEPTKNMRDSGLHAMNNSASFVKREMAVEIYQAMLAAAPQPPVVKQPQGAQEPVAHDEDLLERLFWEFDGQRKKTGEERLAFKGKMRFYASEFRARSLGRMAYAPSVSDDMMNLADRLGSEFDNLDPIAWRHLLVYAPQQQGENDPRSVAKVIGMNEDGPMLLWHRAWTDFPKGTKLYIQQQPKREPLTDEQIVSMANPTQYLPEAPEGWVRFGFSRKHLVGFARAVLAAAPQPPVVEQPQGEQEPVAWLKTWDSVGHAQTGMRRVDLTPECETWLANMFPAITPLYTHPQPPRQPLTVEQIDGIIRDLDPSWLDTPTGFEEEFCRAIERAHEIGGEA